MAKYDMRRALIELTVNKALRDIETDPERSIRNLVDLGRNFSNGQFQTAFFEVAQSMLRNRDSAYYTLIKNLVANVSHENIRTFGINVGYNGCTKGAEQIRGLEAKHNFNIPWALSLSMDSREDGLSAADVGSAVTEGIGLGIFVYLLFDAGTPLELLCPVIKSNPDCAFLLFTRAESLNDRLLETMAGFPNLLLSLDAGSGPPKSTAEKLLAGGFLYGAHLYYTPDDAARIENGTFVGQALSTRCPFLFFVPRDPENAVLSDRVCRYVRDTRNQQRYPCLLLETKSDLLAIDKVVSEDACSVAFNEIGQLVTAAGTNTRENCNIKNTRLFDILRSYNRKK